jgi:hypothetical protein
MNRELHVLGSDEIADAHAAIADLGFRSNDFDITERADPSSGRPAPVTGKVTVARKSNGVSKTYSAGDRSPWLTQLESDLNASHFGPR